MGEEMPKLTKEQVDMSKEGEESFEGKEFAEKHKDKIGKKVVITFTKSLNLENKNELRTGKMEKAANMFEGLQYLLDAVDSEKRIETVLDGIEGGEVTFQFRGARIEVDANLIKDIEII